MADGISYEQMRSLFAEFFRGTETSSVNTNDLVSRVKDLTGEIDQLNRRVKKADTGYAALTKSMMGINYTFLGTKKQIEDFSDQIQALDEAIEELTDATDDESRAMQRQLIQRRQETVSIQNAIQNRTKAIKSVAEFTKTVSQAAASTAGSFLRNAQAGSDAFTMASDVMNLGVTAVGSAGNAIGEGLQTAGAGLLMAGGRARIAGGALTVLGTAAGFLSSQLTEAARFAISFMTTEAQKILSAYTQINAAGAVFADGMTGMKNAAHSANLTVRQFSQVLTTNAENLASAGLGMTEAARRIGAVGDVLRRSKLDTQLLNLGFSFEEQASLTADVMANMRRGRSALLQDPQAIAAATADYAENLRTIAAITGEDARKKMEESRALTTQVAFRNKLVELEKKQPGITQKVTAAMAGMDSVTQRAIMEQVTLGTVVNQTANVLSANSSAFKSSVDDISKGILSGTLTVEGSQRRYAEQMDGMSSQLKNFDAIGIAGMATNAFGDINRALSEIIKRSDKITLDATTEAQKNIKDLATTTTTETVNVVNAMRAAQNLAVEVESLAQKRLGDFADITGRILTTIEEQLKKFSSEKDTVSGVTDTISEFGAEIAAGTAAVAGMTAAAVASKLAVPKAPTTVPSAKPTVPGTSPANITGTKPVTTMISGQKVTLNWPNTSPTPAPAPTTAVKPSVFGNAATTGGKMLLSKSNVAAAVGFGVYDAWTDWARANEQLQQGKLTAYEANLKKGEAVGSGAGGALGAWGGAAMGAAAGSVVPVVGTAIGGVVGGILGWFAGSEGGKVLGTAVAGAMSDKTQVVEARPDGWFTSDQQKAAWDKKYADTYNPDGTRKVIEAHNLALTEQTAKARLVLANYGAMSTEMQSVTGIMQQVASNTKPDLLSTTKPSLTGTAKLANQLQEQSKSINIATQPVADISTVAPVMLDGKSTTMIAAEVAAGVKRGDYTADKTSDFSQAQANITTALETVIKSQTNDLRELLTAVTSESQNQLTSLVQSRAESTTGFTEILTKLADQNNEMLSLMQDSVNYQRRIVDNTG